MRPRIISGAPQRLVVVAKFGSMSLGPRTPHPGIGVEIVLYEARFSVDFVGSNDMYHALVFSTFPLCPNKAVLNGGYTVSSTDM